MNDSSTYPRERIRVLIVSPYRLVRESLKELFETNKDIVVSKMLNAEFSLIPNFELPATDVAVIYLEEDDSLEIINTIQNISPETQIVTVINGENMETQVEALRRGAAGVVKKEQNFRFLIEAVRQTSKGEVWFNQSLLSKIIKKPSKENGRNEKANRKSSSVETLTAREIEVIGMIGEGYKNKVIADRLSISEATVRHHLSSIYGKLGVEDRLNLVIVAYQKGLIQISQTGSGI